MKQITGFMAQFARVRSEVIAKDRNMPQETEVLSRAKDSKWKMLKGTQHNANPTTIAMAIFSTFLFLLSSRAVPQRWSIARLEIPVS